MRKAHDDWQEGIIIGGIKICNLCYNDDTTLIAVEETRNEEDLQINRKEQG